MTKAESAWVIEYADEDASRPRFYSIIAGVARFQHDDRYALRFSRRCDAEAMASTFGVTPIVVSERTWL